MKPQERKQRFYLWDYLWWYGEMIRIHLLRPQTRMGGCMVLYGYIMALIIVPLLILSLRLFSADTKIAQLIIYCIVVVVGFCWIEWIYHRRRKSVMKHYSKRSFYPIIGILLFLIPFALIFTMAYYFNMSFRN